MTEEKEKNKQLQEQIKNYQNQNCISSKTVWETIRKPLLIGGIIAGGLSLLFLIYKWFVAKYWE